MFGPEEHGQWICDVLPMMRREAGEFLAGLVISTQNWRGRTESSTHPTFSSATAYTVFRDLRSL